ncbi:unnamed protein product [Prorocentrum cordatum]|uniref:2-oxoglutarate dehydrogenase E1 component n=1 Tax=Prorocentrum cordatum TaxID=2364126 RepID=A0ABN9WPL7_9DINO|nr:unnamed protein product [Polarella glacialis]
MGLKYLIQAFQSRGHEAAALDPLGQHQWRSRTRPIAELTPKFHGFSEADLDKVVSEGNMLWQGSTGGNNGFLSSIQALGSDGELTLREIVERVRATYCGTIGVEYMHISERRRLNWIRQRVETPLFLDFDQEKMISVYSGICLADAFERFLGDKFPTTKRFGIEGGEAVIPGLRALVDRGVDLGVEESSSSACRTEGGSTCW